MNKSNQKIDKRSEKRNNANSPNRNDSDNSNPISSSHKKPNPEIVAQQTQQQMRQRITKQYPTKNKSKKQYMEQ